MPSQIVGQEESGYRWMVIGEWEGQKGQTQEISPQRAQRAQRRRGKEDQIKTVIGYWLPVIGEYGCWFVCFHFSR
jgi:hypothetical protein